MEDLHIKIQEALAQLLQLTKDLTRTLGQTRTRELNVRVQEVVDLLCDEDCSHEEQAMAIVLGLDEAEALQKKEFPLPFLFKSILMPHGVNNIELQIKEAKKILKSQGEEKLKEFLSKIRWDSATSKNPIRAAQLTLLETKIQKLTKTP